eukprot:scaffold8791_cov98-Isochrysis_galbana.AAC.5
MNFLHTARISVESVAENIMTCFSCGVALKISCTSLRMSGASKAGAGVGEVGAPSRAESACEASARCCSHSAPN